MAIYIGVKEDKALKAFAEKLILTKIKNFPGITLEEIFEIKFKKKKEPDENAPDEDPKHIKKYLHVLDKYLKLGIINVIQLENYCFYPTPKLDKYPLVSDTEERDLYNNIIYPAFKKLAESLVYKHGQKSDDPNNDLRDECISHLTLQVVKYDYDRGNSFRFYNVICKNFILQHIGHKKKKVSIISMYRKDSNEANLGADENTMSRDVLDDRFVDNSYLNVAEDQGEFVKYLLVRLAKVAARCQDPNEREFVKAIITIFESAGVMPLTNKRLIYSTVRNITDFKSRDITEYLGNLKEEYAKILKSYHEL